MNSTPVKLLLKINRFFFLHLAYAEQLVKYIYKYISDMEESYPSAEVTVYIILIKVVITPL